MITIIGASLTAVFGLFIFYFLMQWLSNLKLKKLQRRYNPQDDTSRREIQDRDRTSSIPVAPREQPIERVEQSERRELLAVADNQPVAVDKREPIQDEPKLKRFGLFRRKPKVEEVKAIQDKEFL